MLFVVCYLLVVGCMFSVVCCLSIGVCCLLFVVYWLSAVAVCRWRLLAVS